MAADMEAWSHSRYGTFIGFSDIRTLTEVRYHWERYAAFPGLSTNQQDKLRKEQNKLSKFVVEERSSNQSPSRSAGLFSLEAVAPTIKLFKRYWETGTCSATDAGAKGVNKLNPTFVYCLAGEVFDPHYGTFPQGFPLAPALAQFQESKTTPNTSRQEAAIVDTMKTQFREWAESFRASRAANAVYIRCYSGDAIAFCRALDLFGTTGDPATGVFVSAWRGAQINFDGSNDRPVPTTFDVIDTSNLTDHLGLLNLLLVAQPLLHKNPPSQAVLYTETLLPVGEDATKALLDRICTTVPTFATLLGLVPRAYVSGFNSQSNTHELMYSDHLQQYHERVAWVDPAGGDSNSPRHKCQLSINAADLGHVLFGFYDKMFASEQVMNAMFAKPSRSQLLMMENVHYHRETIGALMQHIKRRIHLVNGGWDVVADEFLEMVRMDGSRLVGMNNFQDLCLQLHLFGVYTPDVLESDPHPLSYRISLRQPDISPMFCVVFTIPRRSLRILLTDRSETGWPILQCLLSVPLTHSNAFSAIHPIWGKCTSAPSSSRICIEEDEQGVNGRSGLVVSFWASSRTLEFAGSSVSLCIKSTPQSTMRFVQELGMELAMFTAKLDDKQYVRILPYRPSLVSGQSPNVESVAIRFPDPVPTPSRVSIVANTGSGNGPRYVISFTARVDFDFHTAQKALLDGAEVSAVQIGPCTMKLSFEDHLHVISYPYPIIGDQYRLRIARKSHYVEVIVPVSEPLDAGGYHLNIGPVLNNDTHTTWNIHHVSLNRMPPVKLGDPKKLRWLNPHVASQLSNRELGIRENDSTVKAEAINTLVNIKDSIHALTMTASGEQGFKPLAIGLSEPDQGGINTIILAGALRYDLASATVIVDCAVVPLFRDAMPALLPSIQKLVNASSVARITTIAHTMTAWKKLLPAFVERCRTWSHRENCEYAATGQIPLSTVANENPLCSCGQNIGFDGPEWRVSEWEGFLPFATRAAISPLFAVSYIETMTGVAQPLTTVKTGTAGTGASSQRKAVNPLQKSSVLLFDLPTSRLAGSQEGLSESVM
ncbi:MYND Zn-finger protein [Ceratobasidium sp. AG-Ba]|nr:MYND Zn-finger protein [Ceratobasidium sp. AG-Ba]